MGKHVKFSTSQQQDGFQTPKLFLLPSSESLEAPQFFVMSIFFSLKSAQRSHTSSFLLTGGRATSVYHRRRSYAESEQDS